MNTKAVCEGKARIEIPVADLTKKSPTFFNELAEMQRTINVLFLQAIGKPLRAVDLLSGSGIRGIRWKLETPVKEVYLNDSSSTAIATIKKNVALNNVDAHVHHGTAAQFFNTVSGFNYVDIDPFGTPVPFLDAAVRTIINPGYLAVTATDTAALCGTVPSACLRKYWAMPLRNDFMYETGLRILARKVQMIAAQYGIVADVLYSTGMYQYMRVYFRLTKSRTNVDAVLKGHGYINFCPRCQNILTSKLNVPGRCCDIEMQIAGPLYLGPLWNKDLANTMHELSKSYDDDVQKLTLKIAQESTVQTVGFYNIHTLCKKLGVSIPRTDDVASALARLGQQYSFTHFDPLGIRTGASIELLRELLTRAPTRQHRSSRQV